ncbi:hypothetical protein R1sor_004862 [Riccia sorocarpa]|uniref:Uncharacterized protein n=1 Tax=Riccia sorocarpa TaxID=122646 RepID=A0ABD3HM74_9MARC
MPTAFVGKHLPSIRLMEADLADQYASAGTDSLKKTAQFMPYTFKDLADVDLGEFSAMTNMNMLKYVTGIQRFCVPEDVFCHGEAEEFRAIKINNKAFSQYKPQEFLPETVETNAQRKLVNGQPYEEISYYKKAAPYSPTYYLMSIIAKLFWCNEIAFLQKRAQTLDNTKGLLTKFSNPIDDLKVIRESCKLTDQFALAEPVVGGPEGAPANGDVDIATPKLTFRTRVTTKGRSIVAADAGPSAPASSPTESGSSGELVVFYPIFHNFGQKMGPVLADIMSKRLQASFGPLLLETKTGESLKQQLAQINTKLAESKAKSSSKLDQIQQQLQTEKIAANKFKDLLHKEVSKVSDLDEHLVVLKGEIDNQKFSAERAENAHSTLCAELSKVKTELRMLHIAGK